MSAANEYFILTDADVVRYGLGPHMAPILKKGSFTGPFPIFVYYEPADEEWQAFLDAHRAASGRVEAILDFGDSWLMKKAFNATELKMMRTAWSAVRAHRMRHGGRSS